MSILAVNAGSSSLKFSLHPLLDGQVQAHILSGNMQGLEPGGNPMLDWKYQGQKQQHALTVPEGTTPFAAALLHLRQLVQSLQGIQIRAIAHRVVHGGSALTESVCVTDAVLEQLTRLNSLAPLHQPHNVAGIRQFRAAFPDVPQVACFDTAFHASMPEVASAFALPRELREQGVRRYGFHGLSYQYILAALQQHSLRANGRTLMAHLGNGASLCACRDGASVATTMGFSALDGLMMGTRSGALDAGVMLWLLEQGWTATQIEKLLYKQSGLLGVSGLSADMRRLREAASAGGADAAGAQQAIDLFSYRVVRESGAMIACLGGLDVLAFSGGIGENDAVLRETVCHQLAWLGLHLDQQRNRQADGQSICALHAPDSAVEIWLVPTDEGKVAAREAAALLESGAALEQARLPV